MKLKKEFLVKGKEWRLEYKWRLHDDAGAACWGLCDKASRIIYLDRTLSQEDKWSVFLHELAHAAVYESHSNDTSLTQDVEEVVVSAISDVFDTNFIFRWRRKP